MARKTTTVQINEASPHYRDNGKTFVINEMPADQGLRWADRFIFLLVAADADLPDSVVGTGFAGIAATGVASAFIQAMRKLRYSDLEPLLTEITDCIQYQPPKQGLPLQAIMPGVNCQIEEIQTFWTLRLAWIELHTGFSVAAAAQKSAPHPSAAAA